MSNDDFKPQMTLGFVIVIAITAIIMVGFLLPAVIVFWPFCDGLMDAVETARDSGIAWIACLAFWGLLWFLVKHTIGIQIALWHDGRTAPVAPLSDSEQFVRGFAFGAWRMIVGYFKVWLMAIVVFSTLLNVGGVNGWTLALGTVVVLVVGWRLFR